MDLKRVRSFLSRCKYSSFLQASNRDDARAVALNNRQVVPPFKPLPSVTIRPMAQQPERQKLVVHQNSTGLTATPVMSAVQQEALRQQQQRLHQEAKLKQQHRIQQEALALQVLKQQRLQQQEAMRQQQMQKIQQQQKQQQQQQQLLAQRQQIMAMQSKKDQMISVIS